MAQDLTGMRFGRWTVESRAEDHIAPSGYKTAMWNCICDCGIRKVVRGKSLRNGISKSCGCLQKELLSDRAGKHRGFGTRLYTIWNSMRQRCNNPHHKSYKNYGGRGIKICDEWDDFATFRKWAIKSGYDETADRGVYTLDRIDVNSGYFPKNCRFINMRAQTNNRRETIFIEHDGTRLPLSEWAEVLGVKYCTLWKRYKQGKNIFC